MTRLSAIYNWAARLSAECDQDYESYLTSWLERAEAACNNRLLNQRGLSEKVTHWELVKGVGHHMKRRAYASRELRDHLEAHPVMSRTEYEKQWLEGRWLGGEE